MDFENEHELIYNICLIIIVTILCTTYQYTIIKCDISYQINSKVKNI